MQPRPTDDPVLRRYKAAVEEMHGDQFDRVILFGSCARADARPDSDYDVAVFLKSMSDWGIGFLENDDAFFDTKPYLATAYEQRTPLMREVRHEGVDV